MKKWFSTIITSVLMAASVCSTSNVEASEKRTLADESIYDLLIDRFYNGDYSNDIAIDHANSGEYAGGDLKGLIAKNDFIKRMDFTIISIGTVFEAEQYDGRGVKSYTALEEHFGTSDDLKSVVQSYAKSGMKIMADFPLSKVSSEHEWASHNEWIANNNNGIIRWNFDNDELQSALLKAIIEFVSVYQLEGLRLTNLDGASTNFLNEIIAEVKKVKPNLYVISNEESHANFDAAYFKESNEIYRNIFKNVDQSTDEIMSLQDYTDKPVQIMIDDLTTNRFTYDVTKENMYPPTRMKLALATTMLLPGVPVVQYASELVVNGEAGSDAHQMYNFKTDTEMIEFIQDIQQLRNQSETLRRGNFKLLQNKDGFIAFKRSSDDETWIIVLNNTSKTASAHIPINEIGVEKELRGMFESEIVRENKNGEYTVVLDREMVEIYQVIDKKGWNISYIVALAGVFIFYTFFIIWMMKRNQKKKSNQKDA